MRVPCVLERAGGREQGRAVDREVVRCGTTCAVIAITVRITFRQRRVQVLVAELADVGCEGDDSSS
jgi:hypothetical protein